MNVVRQVIYRHLSARAAAEYIGRRIRFSKEARWDFDADADYVAVGAFRQGQIVGMVRYRDDRGVLDSSFTWVHHRHRRRGIGVELWRRAVKKTGARAVLLTPVTPGGRKSVARLRVEGFVEVRTQRSR